tara:strand:+ start:9932 stop:11821 length:1890 start_codon:yes stop_codon:yes gene_type:complete
MSGIGGIIYFDNNKLLIQDSSKLKSALEKRVYDESGQAAGKNFFLCCYQLHTTPESVHEIQPFYINKKNAYIVLDGRIDNRDEIISEFNLELNLTDIEIISVLYQKFDSGLIDHLTGSFSIAIYNDDSKDVLLFRDHAGSKPLFYFYNKKQLIFSSEIGAIKDILGINVKINKKRITDYLVHLYGKEDETFFKDVYKVKKSHFSKANKDQINTIKYFEFEAIERHFNSIEECANEFELLFKKVIRAQMRSNKIIGTKLSGGLDSSSISSVAASISKLNINAYSAVFSNLNDEDFKKTDEKKYMDSVVSKYPNLNHKIVNIDANKTNAIDYAFDDHENYKEIIPHANRYFDIAILQKAKEDNINVLMDGFDGDSVISYGLEYFSQLGKSLQIKKLLHEAKAYYEKRDVRASRKRILNNYFLKQIIPSRFLWLYQGLFNPNTFQQRVNFLKADNKSDYNIFSPNQFANHYDRRSKTDSIQDYHLNTLTWPAWEMGMEFSDLDSSRYGIEERYPFFDKRIMQFCLQVPGDYRISGGVSRKYFRESMKNILPQLVHQRIHKGNVSPVAINSLKKNKNKVIEITKESELLDYVDIDKITRNVLEPFFNGIREQELSQYIFQLIALQKWLKNNRH